MTPKVPPVPQGKYVVENDVPFYALATSSISRCEHLLGLPMNSYRLCPYKLTHASTTSYRV